MRIRLLHIALGAGCWAIAARADLLEDLVKESPFAGGVVAKGPGGQGTGALELRGVFVEGGETFVSVYDPATTTSVWVGLNEPGQSFTVLRFDVAKGEAVVSYQGRTQTISLPDAKTAAIAGQAMAPGAAAPTVPAVASASVPAPGANPGQADAAKPIDEATRLTNIANEIRRRRALREPSNLAEQARQAAQQRR